MGTEDRLTRNTAELLQQRRNATETKARYLPFPPRSALIGIAGQIILLRISDSLAMLLCKIDLHTHRVYPRTSPLGLTRFRSPFLIRENPDDLTDEDAAITTLVTLASRIPSRRAARS